MHISTKRSLESCRDYTTWGTLTQMGLQNENVQFTKRTEYKGVYRICTVLDRDQ